MPRFAITPVAETRDVRVFRSLCDGCDAPRPAEERASANSLWLLTAGAIELRDSAARHVVDPATIFVFRAGHAFTVRHPCGADTCVFFRGPIVDAIAARGAGARMPGPGQHARLLAELAAWRRGDGDELALAEALCAATESHESPRLSVTSREGALADELAYHVRVGFAEPTSLASLADAAGVSMFHATRVFRRVMGAGLHQFRREVRLRHALALLVDGSAPIADVAASTGFASQSHLTNRFHERFGVTPRAARLGTLRREPRSRPA